MEPTTNAAAAAPTKRPKDKHRRVPPASLFDSPTNPRKHLGDLSELAASLKQLDMIEPIVAREVIRSGAETEYRLEVVAGHRRKHAAILAELPDVPIIIREYTDDEVIEVQIVENLERADVHPLDEADGLKVLLDRGRTVAQVADRIGRSVSFIAMRLQLCSLSAKGRKALEDDKLSTGAAQVLARVPAKLQDEALAALVAQERFGNVDRHAPVSTKHARELIEERFMLKLTDAPWGLDDADLVAKAGTCSSCVKRTGNQRELFSDIKSDALCTDPVCFRLKSDAVFSIRRKEAEATGSKVLEGKAAKEALKGWNTEYVRVDGEHYDQHSHKRVKIAAVTKKAEITRTIAQDPDSGAVVELVKRDAVDRALAAARPKDKSKAPTRGESPDAKHRRELRKAKRLVELVMPDAVTAAEENIFTVPAKHKMLTAAVLRYAVEHSGWESLEKMLARRGIEAKKDAPTRALKLFDSSHPSAQLAMVVELQLQILAPGAHRKASWEPLLKLLGVNVGKHEKTVADEEKARAAAKRTGKKAPAVKGAAATKGKLATKVATKKKAARS